MAEALQGEISHVGFFVSQESSKEIACPHLETRITVCVCVCACVNIFIRMNTDS